MIYIVNESILNGTITVDSIISGIEAETFEKAMEKLKSRFSGRIEILHEDTQSISFYNKQECGFRVRGIMKNKPLKIV
jgi:hypothetical protein